jgi:anti-anti-sigma factor
VVVASGEIDLWSAPEVRDALLEGSGSIVLDLRGVTFMDSSGLGLIVSEMQRAREQAFRFGVAVAPRSDAHRILELSGLSNVLELVDDPDAFLAGGAA